MTPRKSARDEYSEDLAVEQPAIELFRAMTWETINAYHETFGKEGTLGRETELEVVLGPRCVAALRRLNPTAPDEAIVKAFEELTRERRTLSPVEANRDVYRLLKEGAKVSVRSDDGGDSTETISFIDWNDPTKNDFLLVSQLWVAGDMYRRRADLVGFVNGIPLVFIELKAFHRRLADAYNNNLRDYRSTIPQLFWFNAFVVLSNGSEARIGSTTASFEHFAEWKKINDEGEEGVVSLETLLRGTCEPVRLLDLMENFTVFEEAKGGTIKKLAKNHQVLGVNRALAAVSNLKENRGRLGVFWHTQGSGKSLSMIFFSQKILRKVPGNWTFVVVTDRDELDDQIAKQFLACGAVSNEDSRATSAADLKGRLRGDARYVFTLIQKFRTEKGEKYPKLSDRSDIIVMTDEAHRSQYDVFAMNMRRALPNAAFIGFTGTPLMAGEEKTREVFGEYVSIYNFRQAIDDGATVPLYYENRIPELQLTNASLSDDIYSVIEEAELDEGQEKKLERVLGADYHLITRDDRLERVADDIVRHFMGRGERGKAMVISIDKATAVRMHDKVRKYWSRYQDELRRRIASAPTIEEKSRLERDLEWMAATDMAVVVSQGQNEVEEMKKKGLDIAVHRSRMVKEHLDEKFKAADDPFRIVFVCAMWMTGFDVPSCSTIYLDKPMRNHTLMQTIARANRVAEGKDRGFIVDYVGVFRSLQKALAIYATPVAGVSDIDVPIKDKAELVELLAEAIGKVEGFCTSRGVNLRGILGASKTGFAKIKEVDDAASALVDRRDREAIDESIEKIVLNDDLKREFLQLSGAVWKLYKSILPDHHAQEHAPICALISVLADKIRSWLPAPDISTVLGEIEGVLDRSIATQGYRMRDAGTPESLVDLSTIDFDALKKAFESGRQRTAIENLRRLLDQKLKAMVLLNHSRIDYVEKFQQMIEEYNAGSLNTEEFFRELSELARSLGEEEARAVREGMTEEELAIFDILTRPDPTLTKKEEAQVKKAAKGLLATLKDSLLVFEWRSRQQSRQAVRLGIERILDEHLPRAYAPEIYERKVARTYEHVFASYYGEGRSVYAGVTA